MVNISLEGHVSTDLNAVQKNALYWMILLEE